MRRRVLRFAALAVVSVVFASCGEGSPAGSETVPAGRLGDAAAPLHYRLSLTIVPAEARFSGRAEIDVAFAEPRRSLFIHGRGLSVSYAALRREGAEEISVAYEQVSQSGVARLDFAEEVPAGPATLVFDYDAPFDTSLHGLYKVVDADDAYIFSQFEAIDARAAFPSFDEPRFKVPFDISVVARAGDEVVSNTPVESVTPAPDGMKVVVFKTTKPLPTYLLAFAVGPLDIVEGPTIAPSGLRPGPIPLRGVTVRGKGERIRYALEETPRLVAILEDYFGSPYPYEKLDLIAAADFAAGAMENAGAIVYRETLILLDKRAPLAQWRNFALVHAHEVSHQWFGDLVTPEWWDDIWLNEAFASWMGNKAAALWYPEGEFGRETLYDGYLVMDVDALPSTRRIREPVTDENGISNAFDGITYDKGAMVLAMFESFLGEAAFRDGVRLHLRRFAHGVANSGDFLRSLAEGAGRPDAAEAFGSFIDQQGVPVVTARPRCLGGAGGAAEVMQRPYAALGVEMPDRLWSVPVCLRPLETGETHCEMLRSRTETIRLPRVCSGPVVVNAGGRGYYRMDYDGGEWRELAAAIGALGADERYALARNADAAMRAGKLDAATFLAVLDANLRDGAWDAVKDAGTLASGLRGTVLDREALPAYRAFLRAALGPRRDVLGFAAAQGEAAGTALLRENVADILARETRDPETLAVLAAAGRAYLASEGREAAGLPAELLQTAMWAAVAEGGPEFGHVLLAALKASGNAQFRRSSLFALTAAEDPDFAGEVLSLILSPALKRNESALVFRWMALDPGHQARTRDWVMTNFDAVIERFSVHAADSLVNRFAGACDRSTRDRLMEFFGPRTGELPGTARALALTIEAIDRCLAFRDAKGAEIAAALRGLAAAP